MGKPTRLPLRKKKIFKKRKRTKDGLCDALHEAVAPGDVVEAQDGHVDEGQRESRVAHVVSHVGGPSLRQDNNKRCENSEFIRYQPVSHITQLSNTVTSTNVGKAVFRSRHLFGRLRLSEVPEPTPAPTKLGWLRLQAKKGGSRRLRLHALTIFILSS